MTEFKVFCRALSGFARPSRRGRALFFAALLLGAGASETRADDLDLCSHSLLDLDTGSPTCTHLIVDEHDVPTTSGSAQQPAREQPEARQPFEVSRRVALVIGNSLYESVPTLPNPQRDADAVAAALRRVGFQKVIARNNLTYQGFLDELKTFKDSTKDADWAVIYYAGHAIQVAGKNYLVPVDAQLRDSDYAPVEAIDLKTVLEDVQAARKLRLVVLDASRSNPFANRMRIANAGRSFGHGLARIEPENATIVAYAAKDGQEALDGDGEHSPFTSAFLKYVDEPGLEIDKLFRKVRDEVLKTTRGKQVPFTYGFLPGSGDLYFVVPSREHATVASIEPTRPALPRKGILETGHSLLEEIGREERGYGLYSYAILVQSNERSTRFLDSVFGDHGDGIPPVEDTAAPKSQTNIFYVPLKKAARKFVLKALEANVQSRDEFIKEFIKKHYDYQMSRSILVNLCKAPVNEIVVACEGELSRGPYIFAYARPASNVSPVPPPFLFLDLSDVHERAFPELISAFKAQVKRDDIADRVKIDTLRLNLLNIVLTAADWVAPVQKSLADIVHTATGAAERAKK